MPALGVDDEEGDICDSMVREFLLQLVQPAHLKAINDTKEKRILKK